jgi:hypothetical protein
MPARENPQDEVFVRHTLYVESAMKAAVKSVIAMLSIPFLLTLTTCHSSHDDIFGPCEDECDYEGRKLCMTDTQYRECAYDTHGCLVWDCST